jgi:hypothetical protein
MSATELKVGDKVIDFRGEMTGVVTNIREGRVSRHVTVRIDGQNRQQENYEHVWKVVEESSDGE